MEPGELKSYIIKFFEPFLPLEWERLWDTLSQFHRNKQPLFFPTSLSPLLSSPTPPSPTI